MEIEKEAQAHNEKISECYYKLQNAIDDQFAQSEPNTAYASTPVRTQPSVQTFSTPKAMTAVQQQPVVREYYGAGFTTSNLFSIDKFEELQRIQNMQQRQSERAQQTVKEESFSLTPFGKMVAGVFALVVVGMLALASVNTKIIQNKDMSLQNLETKRLELIEKNMEIQRRIENANAEDTIREYAESSGMIKGGE